MIYNIGNNYVNLDIRTKIQKSFLSAIHHLINTSIKSSVIVAVQ